MAVGFRGDLPSRDICPHRACCAAAATRARRVAQLPAVADHALIAPNVPNVHTHLPPTHTAIMGSCLVHDLGALLDFSGRLLPVPSAGLAQSAVLCSLTATREAGGKRVLSLDSTQLESLQRSAGPLSPLGLERFLSATAQPRLLDHCSEVRGPGEGNLGDLDFQKQARPCPPALPPPGAGPQARAFPIDAVPGGPHAPWVLPPPSSPYALCPPPALCAARHSSPGAPLARHPPAGGADHPDTEAGRLV